MGFTQGVCAAGAQEPAAGGVSVHANVSIGGSQATGAGVKPVQARGRSRVPSSAPSEGLLLPPLSVDKFQGRPWIGWFASHTHPRPGVLDQAQLPLCSWRESDGTPTVLSRWGIPPRSGLNGPVASVCRMDCLFFLLSVFNHCCPKGGLPMWHSG